MLDEKLIRLVRQYHKVDGEGYRPRQQRRMIQGKASQYILRSYSQDYRILMDEWERMAKPQPRFVQCIG
jgi:hypothetical protein